MEYKIAEFELVGFIDKLGIDFPNELCFVPENIDSAKAKSDLIFTDSISDLTKVFKQNNIRISRLGGDSTLLRSRKNADFFAPALFFSLSLISENPSIVSLSLGVLANYITDFFKGSFGRKKVNLDIYVETNGKKKIKKITYSGDVEGIEKLADVIKSIK